MISQPLGHLFLPITRLCIYFNVHLLHVEIWNPVARLIFYKMPYGVLVAFISKPFLLSCSVLTTPPRSPALFQLAPTSTEAQTAFPLDGEAITDTTAKRADQQEVLICLSSPFSCPDPRRDLHFCSEAGASCPSSPHSPAPQPSGPSLQAGPAPSLTWLYGVCQWHPLMGTLQPWSSFLSDEPTSVTSL